MVLRLFYEFSVETNEFKSPQKKRAGRQTCSFIVHLRKQIGKGKQTSLALYEKPY